MSLAPIAIARGLPAIVCDMATTKQRLACHYARIGDPTPEQDRDWDQLEDRRDALEVEFRASFRAATGIDWEAAEGAMSC